MKFVHSQLNHRNSVGTTGLKFWAFRLIVENDIGPTAMEFRYNLSKQWLTLNKSNVNFNTESH